MISALRIVCAIVINLGAGFVHPDRTPIERRSIQRSNRCLGFHRLRHLDESHTARFARIPIHDEGDSLDGPVSRKEIAQLLLGQSDIEVPNKNISHESILPLIVFNGEVKECELKGKKGDLGRIAFRKESGLRAAARFQLASPWDLWSRRIARFGPLEGS